MNNFTKNNAKISQTICKRIIRKKKLKFKCIRITLRYINEIGIYRVFFLENQLSCDSKFHFDFIFLDYHSISPCLFQSFKPCLFYLIFTWKNIFFRNIGIICSMKWRLTSDKTVLFELQITLK